jgi:hypothetical protein
MTNSTLDKSGILDLTHTDLAWAQMLFEEECIWLSSGMVII